MDLCVHELRISLTSTMGHSMGTVDGFVAVY